MAFTTSQGRVLSRYFSAKNRGLKLLHPSGTTTPAWVNKELPFRFWSRLDFGTEIAPGTTEARDKSEPQWLLCGPDGQAWRVWAQEPSATAVREVIEGQGWKGRLERLDEIIHLKPLLLEAHFAALAEATAQYLNQVPVNAPPPMDDALAARKVDLERRLNELHALADWPLFSTVPSLSLGELGRLPESFAPDSSLLATLRQDLLATLRVDPSDETLRHLGGGMTGGGLLMSAQAEQLEALIQQLPLPPGTPLPWSLGHVLPKALAQQGAWTRMGAAADQALQMLATTWSGQAPYAARLPWEAARFTALLGQGQVRSVREKIAALVSTSADYRNLPSAIQHLWEAAPLELRKDQEALAKGKFEGLWKLSPSTVLFTAPGKEPAPPTFAFRLGVIGKPAWEKEFQRLRSAPALDGWAPGELSITNPPPTVVDTAQVRLEGKPGWVFWSEQGGLLAWGNELPTPAALHDRLLIHGTPRLEILSAFLRQHPENRVARRERYQELLARMPHPRLEVLLLEDAIALGEAPLKLGWPPNALWEAAALRQAPRAELKLQAHPGQASAWKAWHFWASFRGTPNAVTKAQELTFVPADQGDVLGDLPRSVCLGVLDVLEQRNQPKEAGLWARFAWERYLRPGLENSALRRSLILELNGKEAWLRDHVSRQLTGLIRPLADALRKGHQNAALAELQAALASLKPGLERMALPAGQ